MPKGYKTTGMVSPTEARVWRALEKANGWLTVVEIMCLADVGQPTAHQILRKLVCKGLIERVRIGPPLYFRAKKGAAVKEYAALVKQALAILEERETGRKAS